MPQMPQSDYGAWDDVGPPSLAEGVVQHRPFATIVKRTGTPFSYTLTPEDVLWAAKMAAYEGDPAEVLWAMTQRFVATYPGQRWPSFTAFARSYSQPIAPKWTRHGFKCDPQTGTARNSARCTDALLDKRDQIHAMTWYDLEAQKPTAVSTTLRWAKGMLSNPVPTAVHFAAPSVSESWLQQNPTGTLVTKRNNWFLATSYSKNWRANHVVMHSPQGNVAAAEPESVGKQLAMRFFRRMIHPMSIQRV